MRDFVKALPVILFQLTCPGDQRAKGAQFQSTRKLCRESHKTQVWLCFLVLSLWSASTCATSVLQMTEIQLCLKNVENAIQTSDALLYCPSMDEIKHNCTMKSLQCFTLEMIMVLDEEDVKDNNVDCFYHFNLTLHPEDGCPPCETFSLNNIQVFVKRFETLLQAVTTKIANT